MEFSFAQMAFFTKETIFKTDINSRTEAMQGDVFFFQHYTCGGRNSAIFLFGIFEQNFAGPDPMCLRAGGLRLCELLCTALT